MALYEPIILKIPFITYSQNITHCILYVIDYSFFKFYFVSNNDVRIISNY